MPEASAELYEAAEYYESSIPYFVRGDVIVIAAVAHGHRRPEYWKQRLRIQ